MDRLKCPHCQREIKLADPGLLGKKVKCPGCQQPFVCQLPAPSPNKEEVVELRLANEEVLVGTAPRLIGQPAPQRVPQPAVSLPVSGGSAIPSLAPPTPIPASRPEFSQGTHSRIPAVPAAPRAAKVGGAIPDAPVLSADLAPPGTVPPVVTATQASSTVQRSRRKRANGAVLVAWGIGLLAVLSAGGYGLFLLSRPAPVVVANQPVADEPQLAVPARPAGENRPYSAADLAVNTQFIQEFYPTQGGPIGLEMLPDGINLLVHLRPAALWSEEYDFQVLRVALTEEVTNWLAAGIERITRHRPEQIEELTVGFLFGARGMEPQFAAVVRLKDPGKLSELTEKFPGTLAVEIPPPLIRINDTQAVWIHEDLRTIVIWPKADAGNGALAGSANVPADVSANLERILRVSDRQRLFTIAGDLADLKLHAEQLVSSEALQPLTYVLNWFGEDVETIGWTLHPAPHLFSQVVACPRMPASNPAKLKGELQGKLKKLPEVMWQDVALKMQPREKRVRDFVGRFPAMLEAFQQSTVLQNDPHQVILTTVLPAKAAPNLALATLFTASEARQTNFQTAVAVAGNTGQQQQEQLPKTVVERLKQLKVDAEFERVPIEQAITYICNEVKVKVFVDGDAFKDAGWTKNMPQTFNLGKVSGERALGEIIKKYNEVLSQMVVSINEAEMKVHVTTRKFAERDNLPIYEFPKFD